MNLPDGKQVPQYPRDFEHVSWAWVKFSGADLFVPRLVFTRSPLAPFLEGDKVWLSETGHPGDQLHCFEITEKTTVPGSPELLLVIRLSDT